MHKVLIVVFIMVKMNDKTQYTQWLLLCLQMYTDLTSRYDMAKKAESELRSQVLALKKVTILCAQLCDIFSTEEWMWDCFILCFS